MNNDASNPPIRLVVVAADTARAQSLTATLATALVTEAAPRLVASVPAALKALRSEPCDAVIALHEPGRIDALVLARALRGAGDETPVAVLGHDRGLDLESAVWDAGAEEYACLTEVTATQLAGRLRRAIDARERMRESRRLLQADQQRLARDRDDAERLISVQQQLLAELNDLPHGGEPPATLPFTTVPPETAYADLLRSAMLGQTTTSVTLGRLADDLAAAGVGGPRLLQQHLAVVEATTAGLPPKATLQMRGQADRLLLESVLHLAEAYKRRYLALATPIQQPSVARAA